MKGTQPTEEMDIEKNTRIMEDVTLLESSPRKTECRKVVLKIAVFVLALCGFGLSITGVVQLHQFPSEDTFPDRVVWELYGFQWWVLAFEAFVLVLLVVMEGLNLAKEVYPMLAGLLLFACIQTEQAGWLACEWTTEVQRWTGVEWERAWSCDNRWSRERNLTAAGFALLLCVNFLAAVIMGLGGFSRNRGEIIVARDDEKSVRILGLVLAVVGISGMAMVVTDSFEDKCEDSWWSLAWHSSALLLFIFTQVMAKMDAFRPVLTILLAFQIRRFEISVDGTDDLLGKVGLLVTIISAYLLIILCIQSDIGDKDGGMCGLCYEEFPRRLARLFEMFLMVALVCSTFDLIGADYYSPVTAWILPFRIIAIIFWIVCLVKPRLLLRLPLDAFMAMAIYHSPYSTHAWLIDDQAFAIRGVANLILTVLFLLLIMMMGVLRT